MNRREFLLRSGGVVGVSVALGGCTEETLEEAEREPPAVNGFFAEEELPLPVTQRLDVAADGVRAAENADVEDVDAFEQFLKDQGFTVEALEESETKVGEPMLSLEYVVPESRDVGLAHQLGVVAGGYAGLVDAGHDSETLDASLLQPAGEKFGEYEVRHHWATEYNAGELTVKEYVGEVLEGAKTA